MEHFEQPTRRRLVKGLGGVFAFGLSAPSAFAAAPKADPDTDILNETSVLRDPALPVGGNPKGDISLVEWSDYQCPYCRKIAPDLRALVAADGKLRMIHKDWPILGPESVYAAGLVLATRFQDRYLIAQEAMIGGTGRLTESVARDRLAAAGIDVDRAVADASSHKDDIGSVLKRNDDQAKAFGFEATPSFIIGKFRVPGVMSMKNFALAIADARKAAKVPKKPGQKI